VICSASFRTTQVDDVPQSEKFEVEHEYRIFGIAPVGLGQRSCVKGS
jgi:hypothetical protein